MTDQHPITPPSELVRQWDAEGRHQDYCTVTEYVVTSAAQWGADQELEACCKVLEVSDRNAREFLYAARRPKPPSLKSLALKAALIELDPNGKNGSLIIRALEALPDD